MFVVRLYQSDSRTGRKHRMRHTTLPQQRVPQPGNTTSLLGTGQDQDKADFRTEDSLLDLLTESMYDKHGSA